MLDSTTSKLNYSNNEPIGTSMPPSNSDYLQLLQKLKMYEKHFPQLGIPDASSSTPPTSDTSTTSSSSTTSTTTSSVRRQTISAPMTTPRPLAPTVTLPTRQPTTTSYVPPNFQNSDDEIFREFINQVVTTANQLRSKNRQNE